MTEVKKKNYVSPSMEVYEVESTHLLAKSKEASIGGGIGEGGCED